jgi:hypothetical protein
MTVTLALNGEAGLVFLGDCSYAPRVTAILATSV